MRHDEHRERKSREEMKDSAEKDARKTRETGRESEKRVLLASLQVKSARVFQQEEKRSERR